jgi:hypothetical protein
MSQSSQPDGDSLDLLLDTICNTFGGVLFISMLVVVLLNMSGKDAGIEPPDPSAQAALVEMKKELEETGNEVKRLDSTLEDQQLLERRIFDDPELEAAAARIVSMASKRQDLLDERNTALNDTAESQIEINRIARELKDLDDAMAEARRKLELIEQRFQQEVRTRTRTAKLPTPRHTAKTEIAFFLRSGRLCSYAKPDASGNLVLNEGEYEERTDGQGNVYIEPKANAGIHVDPEGGNLTDVADKLTAFDKETYYLAIFVWPDSFEHFGVIRSIIVRQEYEYRLVPFPEDGKIYLGPGSDDVIVF